MKDADGITWQPDRVIPIGDTFDWAYGDGNNPYNTVYQHSDFTSAYEYNKNGHTRKLKERESYTKPWGRTWHFKWGTLKDDSGKALAFPRRVDGANNVDTNYFFQQRSVLNEVLFMASETPSGRIEKAAGYGAGAINADKLKAGIYTDDLGNQHSGKYLIMVEPGAYMPINGIFTAFTMRDAMAMGKGGPTSTAPAVVASVANALQLENKGNYKDLGLKWHDTYNYTNIRTADSAQFGKIREHAGIGLVWFTGQKQQALPVINYYYNVQESEVERDTKTNKIKSIDFDKVFSRGADYSGKAIPVGNKYTATAVSSPEENKQQSYTLYQGYLANKEEIQGNLDKSPE